MANGMYRQALHINTLWTIHHSHRPITAPTLWCGGQKINQGLVVNLQVGYSDGDARIDGTGSRLEDLHKGKEFVSSGAGSQTQLVINYSFQQKLFGTSGVVTSAPRRACPSCVQQYRCPERGQPAPSGQQETSQSSAELDREESTQQQHWQINRATSSQSCELSPLLVRKVTVKGRYKVGFTGPLFV